MCIRDSTKFWGDRSFADDIARKAEIVRTSLTAMSRLTESGKVKGRGLMQGLDVGTGMEAASIRSRCVEQGLLIESSGSFDQVLKVMAPLTIPDDLLIKGLGILARSVAEEYRIAA